ncbi:hypothetical protein BDV23DRAFT_151452 [Aspergillus alliaceus]|uniref:Uncharacterized protein n=1 Tax=Petromyces alliaceus TaxID=209559 RepID=A0A5N7CFH4_PETAA|nr:uncharacterized protein BDW43DRAFT_261633 [Aspergillus alliaceus]KAB8238437.1 hypothetical protein BDW43DRAFT_261633 [Aspergillus alliaceus]KAE8392293.1 hypothetical protein BDV23DRAFT_151452 [Aspergillus alliaceus]
MSRSQPKIFQHSSRICIERPGRPRFCRGTASDKCGVYTTVWVLDVLVLSVRFSSLPLSLIYLVFYFYFISYYSLFFLALQ